MFTLYMYILFTYILFTCIYVYIHVYIFMYTENRHIYITHTHTHTHTHIYSLSLRPNAQCGRPKRSVAPCSDDLRGPKRSPSANDLKGRLSLSRPKRSDLRPKRSGRPKLGALGRLGRDKRTVCSLRCADVCGCMLM